jgi:hypothetical protein
LGQQRRKGYDKQNCAHRHVPSYRFVRIQVQSQFDSGVTVMENFRRPAFGPARPKIRRPTWRVRVELRFKDPASPFDE